MASASPKIEIIVPDLTEWKLFSFHSKKTMTTAFTFPSYSSTGITALSFLHGLTFSRGGGLIFRGLSHAVLYKHSVDSLAKSCGVKL